MEMHMSEVSVPCRGILFFNGNGYSTWYTGNNVSVPCRGILFFNPCRKNKWKKSRVSVPCRGILFFNYQRKLQNNMKVSFRPLSGNLIFQYPSSISFKIAKTVSVPCRGILFFNDCVKWKRCWIVFPSPVGESYFSIIDLAVLNKDTVSFRPLSGNLIFQWRYWNYCIRNSKVSVPCRGILFFNETIVIANIKKHLVSVPCRGILFFNWDSGRGQKTE